MPNPENIEDYRWKKGQSGNLKGRPKGTKGISETLRELLDNDGIMTVENVYEVNDKNKETGNSFRRAKVRIPKKDMIILAAIKKSVGGNMRAIEFIFDRMEGMAVQPVEINGPKTFKISYYDDEDEDQQEE